MSDFNSMLEDITEKTAVLKENKVAKTAYTDTAYANDDAEGVSSYAYAQEQNIPDIASIDTNDKILTKGFRSQSASIPRMYLNHMFGRISFNLNKAIDYIHTITQAVVELNRLGGKYSPSTQYRQFDTCSYPIAVGSATRLMRFIRVSDSPEVLTGVPPVNVGGDINVNWADAYSYKANLASPAFSGAPTAPTPDEGDNTTRIATTSFVQAIASAIATALGFKADIASPDLTGEPTAPTPPFGDASTRIATTEFVASAFTGVLDTPLRFNFSKYQTAGNHTWVKPAGHKFAIIYVVGACGAGGYGRNDTINWGAGGGGGCGGLLVLMVDLTTLTEISFTIGAGGAPVNVANVRGGSGDPTVIAGVTVNGGQGGHGGVNRSGGAGGTVDASSPEAWADVLIALQGRAGGDGAVGPLSGYGAGLTFKPTDNMVNPAVIYPLMFPNIAGVSTEAGGPRSAQSVTMFNPFPDIASTTFNAAVGGGCGGPHVIGANYLNLVGGAGSNGLVAVVSFR